MRRDLDDLRLLALLTGEVADLVRVLDDFLHVFSAQRVEHVEGVSPVRLYTFLISIREVLKHFRILLDHRPYRQHRDLRELRRVDGPHLRHLKQFLLVCQHLLDEVLREDLGRGDIQLHYESYL